MKTLIHLCCAPCANRPVAILREEGMEVTGFWYNPNIHPYTEHRSRKECLESYAKEIALPLVITPGYEMREFIQKVSDHIDTRCQDCYRMRLQRTAQYAAQNGFDSFTTSLLISPYQNIPLLWEVGQAVGEHYGVSFLARDFRDVFRAGQDFAREHHFYMQKYCGCIFSEEDRYRGKKRKKKQDGAEVQGER